jgi:aldehyde dehydrogenase (NAD+)
VAIANNTTYYGRAGYVQGGDIDRVRNAENPRRPDLLNGEPPDRSVPFGDYKQSGNGREHGILGFEEYLGVKAVLGYRSAEACR